MSAIKKWPQCFVRPRTAYMHVTSIFDVSTRKNYLHRFHWYYEIINASENANVNIEKRARELEIDAD